MTAPPTKVACPGCGQGWVVPVRVRATGALIFVCEECETTWLQERAIGKDKPTNFMDYMQSEGLNGLWTEVERMS